PLARLDPGRPLGPPLGSRVREKLPLFAISVAAGLAAIAAQRARGATRASDLVPFGERLANAAQSAAWYVAKTAWPSDLSFFYPLDPVPAAIALACAAGLAVATSLAVGSWRARPWLAVGWLWYLVMLLPVSGLLQVGEQARADRYTYLPSVGLLIAAVWTIRDLARETVAGRRAAAVAAAVAIAACAVATRREIAHWRSGTTLFARALERDPGNYKAHYLLGLEERDAGRDDAAIAHFEAALRARPAWADPRLGWANLLLRRDRAAEALPVLAEAAERADANPQVLNTYGLCLLSVGRPADAERFLRRAVEMDPGYANARFHLGDALAARGDLAGAVEQWQAVAGLAPRDAEVRIKIGLALGELGKQADAIASLRDAIRLAPASPEARYSLAVALHAAGDAAGSRREIDEALRLRPGWQRAAGFREGLDTGSFPPPDSLRD
ncbi:MAG: tetratricopeptide repeat protein, partial [Planctomycetota bacterium]